MKQYTTPDQTAKLIELGFERPESYTNEASFLGCGYTYSVGELISFLPQFMNFDDGKWPLSIEADPFKVKRTWWVFYAPIYHTESKELIDAIFAMVVKLKEEGVI